MRSLLAVALLLALASLTPGAHAASAASDTVNLVWAENHGCSDDRATDPDLRVTVTVDGRQVFQAYAEDTARPEYAQTAQVPHPTHDVSLQIKVEEGEPGGFFGLGTDFIPCDDAQGSATVYKVAWHGESTTIDAVGDDKNAASVRLVIGQGAPALPNVSAQNVGEHDATLVWDADPHGLAAAHRLAYGDFGPTIRSYGGGAGSYTFQHLCDDQQYSVRVIRDAGAWSVAGDDVTFTTQNVAPAAPVITGARVSDGKVWVDWQEPTPHDITHYDIHAGNDTSFSVDKANMVGTDDFAPTSQYHNSQVTTQASYIRVVAYDKGSLGMVSEAFKVGAPATHPTVHGEDCSLVQDTAPAYRGGNQASPAALLPVAAALMLAAAASRPRLPHKP